MWKDQTRVFECEVWSDQTQHSTQIFMLFTCNREFYGCVASQVCGKAWIKLESRTVWGYSRHDVFLRLFVNRFTLDVFTKRFFFKQTVSLVPITFYPNRPQHNDHMTTGMFYNVKWIYKCTDSLFLRVLINGDEASNGFGTRYYYWENIVYLPAYILWHFILMCLRDNCLVSVRRKFNSVSTKAYSCFRFGAS